MKKYLLMIVFGLLFISSGSESQWREVYATYDDETNGTGDNTPGVGVISENTFVALVTVLDNNCFLIPYVNADSALGRKMTYGYSPSTDGVYKLWNQGFEEVYMKNAYQIAIGPDSLIYVANNDPTHSILVFSVKDTIEPVDYRLETGSNGIFAIHVDKNGYVYVLNDTTTGKTDDLRIYSPKAQWPLSRQLAPVRTIDLPDGIYKGIVTNKTGTILFISDYTNRKVLRYTGSPAAGYTIDNSFSFTMERDTMMASAKLDTASVMGLAYYDTNDLLFVACDKFRAGSAWYPYGRIYMVHPKTGARMDTLDQAKWNFLMTGGYSSRSGGTKPGNASGYTSTYEVDVDSKGNVYTVSYYGWTVEKWSYTGTLPKTSAVHEISSVIPDNFALEQNYPNPFNPSTTIRFSLKQKEHVMLTVTNTLGQVVETILDGQVAGGTHEIAFDARRLPSGVYFYTIRTASFTQTRKMIMQR